VNFQIRRTDGRTVLFHALTKQKFSVANTILSKKISTVPQETYLAFFTAWRNGESRSIEQAVRAGVHVDLPDKSGKTALMACALKKHTQTLNTLFKLGANLDARDSNGKSTLALLAMKGNLHLVQLLLKRGANVNSQDKDGNTILMLSVQSGKLTVIEELLKHEQIDIFRRNAKNRNVIFTAVQCKRAGLISKLLNTEQVRGKEDELLKVVDVDGYSPLYYAAVKNLTSVINILTKRDLSLSQQDQDGLKTKWFQASEDGEVKKIKCLLLAGFDSSVVDADGNTGLILTAKAGQEDAVYAHVRGCTNHGFELDFQDQDGNSALHWAVKTGELGVVEALVNSGCNLSLVNIQGYTPIHIAEMKGFEEIFHLLKNRGALYGDQVVSMTPQISICKIDPEELMSSLDEDELLSD